MNKDEVMMEHEDGRKTEVNKNSIAAMEACGFKVYEGQSKTKEPEDMTVAELHDALTAKGVAYGEKAKKAELVELLKGAA